MHNNTRNTGIGKLACSPADRTNHELADIEAERLASTAVKLERFRTLVGDTAAFAQLIRAVGKSTLADESIAELKQRLTKLGPAVLSVAREVSAFL